MNVNLFNKLSRYYVLEAHIQARIRERSDKFLNSSSIRIKILQREFSIDLLNNEPGISLHLKSMNQK